MEKHYYCPKSGKVLIRQKRMTKKLSSTESHLIVRDYMKIKRGKHNFFTCVDDLLKARNISRNVPSKHLKKFEILRKELYPNKEIDYKVNIFLERSHLRKHRSLPANEEYEAHVKRYPRGGYQSYQAGCSQKNKDIEMKEGKFYYYKKGMKSKTASKAPNKKIIKWRMPAKERYTELYKTYDFVIHLDGKSMEDQERIWKNGFLRTDAKWLTLGIEAQSGADVGIWIEKSHNKSNAFMIIQEICEHIKTSFSGPKKICFITDAGSEYLSNTDLRGLEITSKEVGMIAEYLKERGHGRRITRRPEDNGFVENKNDYIERNCLDSYEIQTCDKLGFACLLDSFLDRNNSHLRGCKKSFRGKGVTPEENIKKRFGEYGGARRIRGLHTKYIEKLYLLPSRYKKLTIPNLLEKLRLNVKPLLRRTKNAIFCDEKVMHPKSLDSSFINKGMTCNFLGKS